MKHGLWYVSIVMKSREVWHTFLHFPRVRNALPVNGTPGTQATRPRTTRKRSPLPFAITFRVFTPTPTPTVPSDYGSPWSPADRTHPRRINACPCVRV
jgi:hypothetical protein